MDGYPVVYNEHRPSVAGLEYHTTIPDTLQMSYTLNWALILPLFLVTLIWLIL